MSHRVPRRIVERNRSLYFNRLEQASTEYWYLKNADCRGWISKINGKWKMGGYHRLTKHPNKLKHHNLTQLTFDL
jgi:hypothetical protein